MDTVASSNILPGYRSDHSFIELKLVLNKFQRGKGVWKFNCSLLKNKEYLKIVNELIGRTRTEYAAKVYNINQMKTIPDMKINLTISESQFLEVLLLKIRGETIKFSSQG